MIIDEIRREEDYKRMQKAVQQLQQGYRTSWEGVLQRSLTWNEVWHMTPFRISFLIRAVYDLLPSYANLLRWGMKDDPTCPLCQSTQTTEHVLSSCKVAPGGSWVEKMTSYCISNSFPPTIRSILGTIVRAFCKVATARGEKGCGFKTHKAGVRRKNKEVERHLAK
ncbi:reverse transcriptase [Plakobranchus ocellatus]|uniref:Reverse transcriptase n=1 Tax=Plakobranchus ocellatus TaxID=259542 RepID=A0AAV4DRN6_9GAST|nr:reverse transcriptase [Plakobranchus ocellatus]